MIVDENIKRTKINCLIQGTPNIQNFKANNSHKYQEQIELLQAHFNLPVTQTYILKKTTRKA